MLKASVLGLLSFLAVSPATAAPFLVDSSVTRDAARGTAAFEILYSSTPDLFTSDQFARTKDSFQFYIDPDNGPTPSGSFGILIRGEEIKYGGDIRIRDRFPKSSDPQANGWGPLRGSVAFEQAGPLVSFVVPFDLLDAPDGYFSYQLITTRFGDSTGVRYGSTAPAPIPLPPAIALLATAIAGLGALAVRARRIQPAQA